MHFSGPVPFLVGPQKIVGLLEQIRGHINEDKHDFCHRLGLSTRQYSSIVERKRSLPIDKFCTLVESFDLDIDAVFNGPIDLNALLEHQKGNLSYIPEKYLIGAASKKRNILNVFRAIETFHSHRVSLRDLFRYFQVHKEGFKNPDESINLSFCQDVFEYLRVKGLQDSDYVQFGVYSSLCNKKTLLAKNLRSKRDLSSLYESLMTEYIHLIEKNCDYQIKTLAHNRIVIQSKSKQNLASALSTFEVGGPEVCLQRIGVLKSVPVFKDRTMSKVIETKCVHQGHSCCQFEVDFN